MIAVRRAQQLALLAGGRFDLLIIGGGIVGAGIARDAAMRGLKAALVEQGDFAGGASSKTSKLIHGGLRYLEHGHLRLVFESLRERRTLKTIAPALVHPLPLMVPVYQGGARPAWKVSLGLSLYDLLAWGRNTRSHRMVPARKAVALESELRQEGLRAAGVFQDCQMDDARLCLANILQAAAFGAVCCNYVRLRALLKSGGRVCGGAVEDIDTGRSIEVQARVVVNAAGPWADRVRQLSDASAAQRLAPTKGSHLILPRLTQHALFVEARKDRRMFFILPWGEHSLVGTTERLVDGALEDLRASSDEVGYLLEEVQRALPGRHLTEDDVIATYAGARPLLAYAGTSSRASREHRIEEDQAGLVSVMGGKYTTYRLMAQQAVDGLMRRHHWTGDRCLTDQISVLEAVHPVTADHWQDITRTIDPDLLARLLTRYGAAAARILQLLAREPALGRRVCLHHEEIAAEIVHAFEQELACTVTDVLARRTRIAWSSCQGLDLLSTVVDLFQRYGGLTEEQVAAQVDAYHRFLGGSLGFRQAALSSKRWAGDGG